MRIENKAWEDAIIALSKGDKEALSVLYDLSARMIFSTALGITGNVHDAEDVLQNTMMDIMKYAPTYRKETSPKAWILTMVRHRSIDLVRKRKHTVSMEEEQKELFARDPNPLRLEVLDMLEVLDPEDRQIVLFRLYVGMPHKEIAKILGMSAAAAQKRYRRAIKKLKTRYMDSEVDLHDKT
ncbi:MAG: RNA polymerase sigma factor [Clostridia bacterium]|nr:sigma-70 family RNA polymerase sigma factor [Clostridiaceae bacterium]